MPVLGYGYKRYLISWLDVLGFKQLVAEKSCEVAGRKIIWNDSVYEEDFHGTVQDQRANTAMTLVRTMVHRQECQPESSQVKMWQFADSFVRLIEIERGISEDALSHQIAKEVAFIAELQMTAVSEGTLLRGSIVFGPALYESFRDDPGAICFGPAMNRAHELESSVAIYPRVIVDRMTLPVENLRTPYVRLESDGQYSVHYLMSGIKSGHNLLRDHRNMILAKKKEFSGSSEQNTNLRQKYSWLETYHDSSIRDNLPHRPDLLVSA